MTKRMRKTRRRSCSEGDIAASLKRIKRVKHADDTQISSNSSEIVAHFQALQSSVNSRALAEVYEWLGDAVIGELVGRCLLSQFHCSPLSARVYRNLRLAVVTNRNLAKVYDSMGYAAVRREGHLTDTLSSVKAEKIKERADVVEAIVGELVLRLNAHKKSSTVETGGDLKGYRQHLDTVVATMLHCHFAERTKAMQERGETMMAAKGPLSVAFNPFGCLPEEQLDEITGELVVREGVFEHDVVENEDKDERSFSDLIDEYKDGVKQESAEDAPHHYFLPAGRIDAATRVDALLQDGNGLQDPGLAKHVRLAMLQLDEDHILRTSAEVFEVFKIYGMAVLSERMSLSLAMPHVSVGFCTKVDGGAAIVTPARLTRQRQLVLSVANLSKCASSLWITEPLADEGRQEDEHEAAARRTQEEHGRANTLRAFVGFHSAIATASTVATRRSNTLVNAICATLYESAFSTPVDSILPPSKIPDRSPLTVMMRSVGEARMFMKSKTCNQLHAPGERPVSDASLERKKNMETCFMLRRCDSEILDDLFATLDKEQSEQRKLMEAKSAPQMERRKRAKKKKTVESIGAKAAHMTGNLERFLHRRFLFCLEEIIVLFAQRKTEDCRARISLFEHDLEPCVDQPQFRKWEVTTSTLTLAMRDSFYRLLLHDVCQFHAVVSSSKNTRDGTRITQLRLPIHYTWKNIGQRITTEQQARC